MSRRRVTLPYGSDRSFEFEVDADRVVAVERAPPAVDDLPRAVAAALARPLEFPPAYEAVVPGDRVTIALDRHTPRAATLVAGIWKALSARQIDADQFTIVQPASRMGGDLPDPRAELPGEIRERAVWRIHDPSHREASMYLASTATGERIYLAKEVIDADFLLTVGPMAFDSILGYRGTNSVLYPGLSMQDAMNRAHGQGHVEIGPDEPRPLREMIDEVGWLLGSPFTVQVLPAGRGGVSRVLAGSCDSVFSQGKKLLMEEWFITADARPEIVVASIDAATGAHAWEQLGAALATIRNLVARGGKIVLLSQLDAELTPGLELIRGNESARDALKPLRNSATPDLVYATQLAAAADWASVYLLSGLSSETVEELFMTPLAEEEEARRLLEGSPGAALFLESAEYRSATVASS